MLNELKPEKTQALHYDIFLWPGLDMTVLCLSVFFLPWFEAF